jgi:hypothetical protein
MESPARVFFSCFVFACVASEDICGEKIPRFYESFSIFGNFGLVGNKKKSPCLCRQGLSTMVVQGVENY